MSGPGALGSWTDVSQDPFFLAVGRHRTAARGRCAMEWLSHLAGERHGDAPRSVSLVLAGFARSWNDALDDDTRQRLRPFLGRMIATAEDGLDDERAWACADWLTRDGAPPLLDHAGLHEQAERLRALPPLVDMRSGSVALAVLEPARRHAALIRRALRAENAARPGAVDAARHAALRVPRVTGWDAARAGVRGAGRCVARDAIVNAAWHTGWDAAWAAAWRDGLEAAVRLSPVTLGVQQAAFALLQRMLPTVLIEIPPAVDATTLALT
jgi:hypothetical protein